MSKLNKRPKDKGKTEKNSTKMYRNTSYAVPERINP